VREREREPRAWVRLLSMSNRRLQLLKGCAEDTEVTGLKATEGFIFN
jgi:hypothetical protein